MIKVGNEVTGSYEMKIKVGNKRITIKGRKEIGEKIMPAGNGGYLSGRDPGKQCLLRFYGGRNRKKSRFPALPRVSLDSPGEGPPTEHASGDGFRERLSGESPLTQAISGIGHARLPVERVWGRGGEKGFRRVWTRGERAPFSGTGKMKASELLFRSSNVAKANIRPVGQTRVTRAGAAFSD